MGLLMPFAMAGEATGAGFLPRVIGEDENLGLVAATFNMFGPGTVASFTTLLRGAGIFIQSGLPVGRFLPGVVNLFMTRLAGFSTNVF